jgi:hypothetical protein
MANRCLCTAVLCIPQDALAQPLGGNISAEQRQELERRAAAMRAAAANLNRVSAVGSERSGKGEVPLV